MAQSMRFRFPASASLQHYVALDTYTGSVVPGVTVYVTPHCNPVFIAESRRWCLHGNDLVEINAKLAQALVHAPLNPDPAPRDPFKVFRRKQKQGDRQ